MIGFSEEGTSFMLAPFSSSIAASIDLGSKLSEAMFIFFIIPFSSSMSMSRSTLPQSNDSLFCVWNSFHLPKRYSSLPMCWLSFTVSSLHKSSKLILEEQ